VSFIGTLPERWNINDLSGTRINLMREGVVTLLGIKRLESEALFVSAEAGGELRETAKVDFAGKERYWWIARKVNGVIRRALLSKLNLTNCTVDVPCIQCEVCGLLGGLNTNTNRALFSRAKLQDLISIQEYFYDEKFRVRLPDDPTTTTPTPFSEVIVPPGTEFPFIVRIIKPSKRDLALFLSGHRTADGLGYGNYSKMRGDATTEWFLMANGFAHISVHNLLADTTDPKQVRERITDFANRPVGVTKDHVLTEGPLATEIQRLIESAG
jgi:hypothetical protein